jgi:PAS domain S-box-containing protein
MNKHGKNLGDMLSSVAPTGKAAEETLHAIVLGEADAIVVETKDGPRVYTLRDASEPYRELVERMPGAAVIVDADQTILYCNGGLARMLRRDALAGSDLLDLVAPAQRGLAREVLIAGATAPSAVEVALISGDGGETPVRASAAPMSFDGQSCVALVVTALDDIEALRTSEAALREGERRFQIALKNSPIVVFEQDLDLRYTWIFNPRLGYKASEVIGKTDTEILDRECAAVLTEIKRRVVETGQPTRQEVAVAAPGAPLEYYDMFVEPRRDSKGRIIGVVCAATDIAEHKKSLDALRRNDALMSLAVDAARMTYAEFDFKRGRLYLAENYARVMGYEPQPPQDKTTLAEINANLLSHVDPEDRVLVQDSTRDFFAGRLDGSVTYRVIGDDGLRRWIEGRWIAETDSSGWPSRGLAVNLDITERKRAEEALHENQQRVQLATEATGVGIWEWNVKTNTIWWDRQMFGIYGIPPTSDGMVSFEVWALSVLPADLAVQVELLRKHALEGGINRREFRIRRQDNQDIRVIEAIETVRSDIGGQVEWVVGTNLDVTESKRSELALKESDERLRVALSGARAAAWQWNILTNELSWSPECYEMYGRDPERDLARYELWRDCLFPEDLEPTERLIRGLIDQGATEYRTQYRVVLPSGAIRWVAAMGKLEYGSDGKPLRMSGINLDISQQKRAEQQLMDSETRFRAAQEASLDAFLIFEPIKGRNQGVIDLKVIYANPMAARYWHSTPELMQGRLLSEIIPGAKLPGGLIEQHGRIFESGRTQEYVLEYDDDGIKGHFRNLVVPFGRYAAATFRDITALVEGTNALAAAKAEAERADQAKSRFLAAASHDLRQPVQSLVLLLSLVERQAQAAGLPKMGETVKMMHSAVGSLNGLLSSILDISRLDAGVVAPEMQTVDVGAIISNLTEEYRAKAAHKELEMRATMRVLWARTDPALLQRVLRNLLENALRYTNDGGVLVGARLRGERVRIDVVDTGVGVSEEQQKHIFEEFFQANNPGRDYGEGLGLGLAIVARLAKLLGGEIEVRSKVGKGSRFSLLLPRAQDIGLVGAKAKNDKTLGGRILVVEDNSIVRQSLVSMLEHWGAKPSAAASGEEALELAARCEWNFDAIVADHRLGGGLTGIETAEEIERRAGRRVPTLVLTGDTAKERIAEIESSGFVILHKPVDAESLLHELSQLMAG